MSLDTALAAEVIDPETIRALYEGERLSFREVALRLGISPWQIYRLMRHYGIRRRRGAEQNYATYKTKPQFILKSHLTPAEEQLRVAGAMLYWGEGVKGGKTVDLANSDPELVRLFLKFLRTVCGVAESRLRILLYLYADQNVEQLKRFWSNVAGVPLSQFTAPYVRPAAPSSHKKMPHGLVHIRYNDARLLSLILQWSRDFSNVWAGT